MSELSLEEFTRIVVRKLEETNENIITSNPDTKETYPLGVVSNPMESILSTDDNNTPIRKLFSISVEWWTDSKYTSMEKYNIANKKLAELNLLPRSMTTPRYDEITKKNIFGSSYEVYFNGITNSFEKIK